MPPLPPLPSCLLFPLHTRRSFPRYLGQRVGEAKNPGPSRQANLGSYFPVSQHLPRNLQAATAVCAPARPGPAAQQDLRHFFSARPGPLQNPGAVPFRQNGARRAPVRSAVAAAPSAAEQPRDSCVIAVVNPTSILHKTHPLLETAADVICLSETSAVSQVQGLASTSRSIPYIATNRHIATIRRIVTNGGSLLREHLVSQSKQTLYLSLSLSVSLCVLFNFLICMYPALLNSGDYSRGGFVLFRGPAPDVYCKP